MAHKSFGGRAVLGHNTVPDAKDDDNVGHGTHCAGTIASEDFGVAKKANVIAVKVMDSEEVRGSLWSSVLFFRRAV